jgi:hypothetical protein
MNDKIIKLIKTKTKTMDNGYGWSGSPYWGFGHNNHGSHYGSLEKSIGDVKSTLLMQLGDTEGRLDNLVSSGQSAILREVGGAKCDILTKVGDSECNVITEVNDAESKIIDRMGTYALNDMKNSSDIAQRQAASLTAMERDIQNRLHETRFLLSKEISDNTIRTNDKVESQFTDVKNQLRYFETSVGKQLCHLETEGLKNTSKILETLAANKYDALKDEVDAIRADRYADKYGYNFALQNQELAYLKNMINSVEQTQRFGSKTVQFGTGNTAGTAQTANQG